MKESTSKKKKSHDAVGKGVSKNGVKGGKGNEDAKEQKQLTLFGSGFKDMNKEALYLGKIILLTDEIFSKKIPEDMKGMEFVYKVTSYDTEDETFTIKYQNRMIKEGGTKWIELMRPSTRSISRTWMISCLPNLIGHSTSNMRQAWSH